MSDYGIDIQRYADACNRAKVVFDYLTVTSFDPSLLLLNRKYESELPFLQPIMPMTQGIFRMMQRAIEGEELWPDFISKLYESNHGDGYTSMMDMIYEIYLTLIPIDPQIDNDPITAGGWIMYTYLIAVIYQRSFVITDNELGQLRLLTSVFNSMRSAEDDDDDVEEDE